MSCAVLLKMARLQRFRRLMRKFEFFAAARMLRILVLVLAFLFLGHIMACMWYLIGYVCLMVRLTGMVQRYSSCCHAAIVTSSLRCTWSPLRAVRATGILRLRGA